MKIEEELIDIIAQATAMQLPDDEKPLFLLLGESMIHVCCIPDLYLCHLVEEYEVDYRESLL